MPLDLSNATFFGDMTQGGGLTAIFDGSTATAGRREATTGWAGVDFGVSAKRIDKAVIVSPALGFDASGLTSPITAVLRGKNGDAPASRTDGVVIGSLSFTDINAVSTREIDCTHKGTAWRYVWVDMTTGVWSTLAEMRLMEAVAGEDPAPPQPSPAGTTVYIRSCDTHAPLKWLPAHVPQFDIEIATDEPSVAELTFQANVKHQGNELSPQYWGVIGVGFVLQHRHAAEYADLASSPWQTVPNGTSGFNISERNPQHYGAAVIVGAIPLAVGAHAFRILGTAHTDADSRDNLARILVESAGLNALRVTVHKGGCMHRI